MTASQERTFTILVDGFRNGEIGENEFIEVGLSSGIPAERLSAVLNEIRETDGVFS